MYFLLERWIFIAMLVYWRVNVTDSCRYFPDSFNRRRNRCLESSHIDPSTPFPDALVDIVDERVRNSLVPSWGFVFWAESWLPWKDQISRQVEHLCLWKNAWSSISISLPLWLYMNFFPRRGANSCLMKRGEHNVERLKRKKTFALFYTFSLTCFFDNFHFEISLGFQKKTGWKCWVAQKYLTSSLRSQCPIGP